MGGTKQKAWLAYSEGMTINRQLLTSSRPSKMHQSMCVEEENAVRYASGFVALKVMKLYEKLDTPKAAQFVECLSHMAVSGEESSFYAYTKAWINSVNRGGLFCINEKAFLFFRAVELATQVHLPNHLSSRSKVELFSVIVNDEDVQFQWSMLSLNIEEESHSAELLMNVIQQWIKIRGFAITSMWMEEYKRSAQETTKGKKSLRKELNKKTKKSPEE